MKKEKMIFNEKYFKIRKELKSRKCKKEQLEEYILEMSAEKAKSETIIKLVEVGIIPMILALFSFVLSLYQIKIFISIIIVLFVTFIELIVSFIIIKKCNNNIYQMETIINLSNEILKKK